MSSQHFDIRLLVLEDDPAMRQAMERGLKKQDAALNRKKLRLLSDWIDHSQALCTALTTTTYHIVSLDLRVPDVPFGTLMTEKHGLQHFLDNKLLAPATPAVVATQYAKDYLGALPLAGQHHFATWQKALIEAESRPNGSPPVLTFDQWAERIVEQLDDYGPAQAYVWWKAKSLLPGALRQSALGLEACCQNPFAEPPRTATAAKSNRLKSRQGLAHAFQLAEQLQHWLWILLVSYLVVRAPQRIPPTVVDTLRAEPGDEGPVEQRRKDKEDQLGQLCAAVYLQAKDAGEPAPLLLTQMGCNDKEPDAGRFVRALRVVRERRNKFAHEAAEAVHPDMWEDIALPLRWFLNVVAYLCTCPVVTDVEYLARGTYRAKRLGSERGHAGSEEWSVPHGILCSPGGGGDAAEPDFEQAYALWPLEPGRLALLPLWPLVESSFNRATMTRESRLYAMRDAHKRLRDVNIDTLAWATQTNGSEREDAFERIVALASNGHA